MTGSSRDSLKIRPKIVPELGDLKVDSLLVREGDHACGRSAAAMQLRSKTEALVVAIRRDGAVVHYASPSEPFRAGDVVFLVGPRSAMGRAMELFTTGEVEEPVKNTPGATGAV
jgi:K+/H+ antiporter YhaU regulatory subunit KhtT